jgi:hypothetical protein
MRLAPKCSINRASWKRYNNVSFTPASLKTHRRFFLKYKTWFSSRIIYPPSSISFSFRLRSRFPFNDSNATIRRRFTSSLKSTRCNSAIKRVIMFLVSFFYIKKLTYAAAIRTMPVKVVNVTYTKFSGVKTSDANLISVSLLKSKFFS